MKKNIKVIITFVFIIIAISCSPRLAEPEGPMVNDTRAIYRPLTKSGGDLRMYQREILHKAQRNHIAILIHSIVFRDGAFVQTLGQKELAELGITEEEYVFAQNYLDELNNMLK